MRNTFLPVELAALHPVEVSFRDQWRLLGLKFMETAESLALAMRWQCLQQTREPVECFAGVWNDGGNQLGSLDHDLLDGQPPAAQWRPGDEGYEVRYLRAPLPGPASPRLSLQADGYMINGAGAIQVRLGLRHPKTKQRLPLVYSTLPVTGDYTEVQAEANQAPGLSCTFRFQPQPLVSCRTLFGDGLELTGYSITAQDGVVWLRLRWRLRQVPRAPLLFFGHAIPEAHPEVAASIWFDQDLAIEQRVPAEFEVDVVRTFPAEGPAPKFIRAGVCTAKGLVRLPVVQSTLKWEARHNCVYLPLR